MKQSTQGRPVKRVPATEETPRRSPVLELLDKLAFSSDDVIGAEEQTPLLFREAIDLRYQTLDAKFAAKRAWEVKQAERSLAIRQEAKAAGEKMTEGLVDAMLLLDPEVAPLAAERDRAEAADEYLKLVVEAFRIRRDSLDVIGYLVRGEMSVQRAVEANAEKVRVTRDKLRNKYPGGEL